MSDPPNDEPRRGVLRLLTSPALWLLTTVAAAALGVIVSHYLDRPGPSVLIADVAISSHFNARFPDRKTVTVPVKDQLFVQLDHNNWLRSSNESTAELSKLLGTLTENENRIESILQQLTVFQTDLPEMRAELEAPPTNETANAFFNRWLSLSDLICNQVDGDIARGTFKVDTPRNYADAPTYFMISPEYDDDHDEITVVGQIGSKRTVACYPRKYNASSKTEANTIIPQALLHFDQAALRRILEDVAREADRYEVYKQVQQDLTTYIQGYSRWAVALLITNSGGQALSFGPDATLFIDSKDYSNFTHSTAVNIQSRTENGDLLPVTIAAGESKLVTFVSNSLIDDDADWKVLLDMFRTQARKSFVVVHPEGDVWHHKDIVSPVRIFGAASGGTQIGEGAVDKIFRPQ